MFRRLQPRFSLRAFLIFVALCAGGLVIAREWAKVRDAREGYSHACALWEARRIRLTEVVDAATRLFEVESATLWIGNSEAVDRQEERLTDLVERAEASVRTTMFSSRDGRERLLNQCEQIRARISDLRSPAEKN